MAASDFHFYEDTFTQVNSALTMFIGDVAANVVAAITPVATILLTIYVVLWGWSMMRGVINEPITDGASRIIRLSLIVGIALSVGRYNTYLSDMLWNSPDVLASYVAAGFSNAASASFLDVLLGQIFDLGDAYWQKANASSGILPLPDLGLVAVALLIWTAAVLVTAYGAFLLILSKMALAILLGVGPLFILMVIFEPTKRFFDAWIGQALNYVFLVMLTAGAIRLVVTIISVYMGVTAGVVADPKIAQALPAIVLCLIGALVMMQLPSIASALGGGVAIGTLGAAGAAASRARNTAGAGKDLLTGKTLSDYRGARRVKAMNARWAANNPSAAGQAARNVASSPSALYRKVTGGNRNRVTRG